MAKNNDSKNQNSQKKEAQKAVYEVTPVDYGNKEHYQAALNELAVMQSNAIVDYKTWSKERLKYTDLDSKTASQNLKECNDAYTMSMLTNCLTPFRDGVSIGSLMSSWFTYKSAQMLNPSFNQDVSRMMVNMRDDMIPMLSQNAKNGSFPMNVMAQGFLKNMDSKLVQASTNMMHNEIVDSLANNTLDDMIMTPRQIAAIKINFMEQYYVDVRQYDIESPDDKQKIGLLTRDYNNAIKHLGIIANNGGFDMTVVAAEERALVGLKIKENPSYVNIFNDTASFYGVNPYQREDNDLWAGDFCTLDDHAFYTTSDTTQGAFTVRVPSSKSATMENLQLEGELFGYMVNSIDGAIGPVPENLRREVLKKVQMGQKEYTQEALSLLQDDFGFSKKEAKAFFDESFVSGYKSVRETKNMANEDEEYDTNGLFNDEFNRIVEIECLSKLGIDYVDDKSSSKYKAMLKAVSDKAIEMGYPDSRSGKKVLDDMRDNYINSMSADDMYRLLLHTSNNMKQGYSVNETFERQFETEQQQTQKRRVTQADSIVNQSGDNQDEHEL